jgi:hypothetical protein
VGDFTHLKSIVFEDVSELVSCFIPSYGSRPSQAVKEICKEAKVISEGGKTTTSLKGQATTLVHAALPHANIERIQAEDPDGR